jgi:hypothetical protein
MTEWRFIPARTQFKSCIHPDQYEGMGHGYEAGGLFGTHDASNLFHRQYTNLSHDTLMNTKFRSR